MKTFRELISWELEQEEKEHQPLQITTEDASGKLGSCVLRKMRHLSAAAASHKEIETAYKSAV
jgi:hypothetical protein